jgi:transposase
MPQTTVNSDSAANPAPSTSRACRSDVFIGLDVGDRRTHACILDEQGEVVKRIAFSTERLALHDALASFHACRVTLEAGSQSAWMSAFLRSLGHDVVVADARKVAAFTRTGRKTDRRDAETLARLLRGMPEMLGRVHHRDERAQADLAVVRARDVLVDCRTRLVQHVRGSLKVQGIRIRQCSTTSFHRTAREAVPESYEAALLPILGQIEELTAEIKRFDRRLGSIAETRRPETERLREIHGVGPITAMAFTLTLDDPARFAKSRDVGAWMGLCPRVQASGDSDPELSISKTGCPYLRRVVVQSAQYILGPFGKDSDLRRYGEAIAGRGGKAAKRRAVVAVARKLAVLMHKLLVSQEPYDPLRNTRQRERAAAAAEVA